MKCHIPEISWHNRDPVLSVDFQPNAEGSDGPKRLASGGSGKSSIKLSSDRVHLFPDILNRHACPHLVC